MFTVYKGEVYVPCLNEEEARTFIGKKIHVPNHFMKNVWLIKDVKMHCAWGMCWVCDNVSGKSVGYTDELIEIDLCYADEDGVPVGHKVDRSKDSEYWKDK